MWDELGFSILKNGGLEGPTKKNLGVNKRGTVSPPPPPPRTARFCDKQ